ncbi:hypothetical protein [Paenibacillus sp.]|uniref:hypothetical protein n=1 Tax=Paenibacillus sp. TaxID=58172 RepID=UPI002D4DC326|nr:hypothetical protein [Paenibacillus sp.]HZG56789.1 hypothetical protein [Paenibacillus sp.]
MIPFSHTWPYDVFGDDVHVTECPFCRAANVILPIRKKELKEIREGKKKLLVFPCCKSSVYIVDTDADYLLADRRLRR